MPTKKKRVGFIPREDVMRIIGKLSVENNLSNSKIISILVEEALSMRGIFNKKTGKETQRDDCFKENIKDSSRDLTSFKDNKKIAMKNESDNQKYQGRRNLLIQTNKEDFNLQTYKQFISFLKFQEMMNEFDG